MTRPISAAVLPLALAETTILLGGCDADSTSSAAPPVTSTPSGSAAPTGPIDLKELGAGTALEPGRYAVPLLGDNGPRRALVDVPEGYFSAGGWVIDDGHGTLAPDEFGDLLFFAEVGRVHSRPCGHGRLVEAGPGVRDLARALTTAAGESTRPRLVKLHERQGLYLEITAPADLDACPGGLFTLWEGPSLGDFSADMPGTVTHLWILDVNGRRIVAAARTVPGHTSHPDELVHMAETAEFTAHVAG